MNKLPLRPNVCMLVFNQEKKLFLGERAGEPGIWQFPQGGVEEGLTLEENVLKELQEELGAAKEKFKIIKKLNASHEYDFDVPPAYAIGKWRGQRQSFWLVEFVGQDKDIMLDKYDIELMNWKWCSIEEVKALAEPKRLAGYLAALGEFGETLSH